MTKFVKSPQILVFDIETAPIVSYTWGLFDQNVGLNQVKQDWSVLSWSAKWFQRESDKTVFGTTNAVYYQDNSKEKDLRDDKKTLAGIHALLSKADVVITQNGKSFDQKKLNARFILQGFKPVSGFKHIDTKEIAFRKFGFTSNKLEYMTDKLCVKYKKQDHAKFPGFTLWAECLKGNKAAWREMKKYNIHDVLATEELYNKFMAWDTSLNLNVYTDYLSNTCSCGSSDFQKNGFQFTPNGKYQRYCCAKCGRETTARLNEFSKEKKLMLRRAA